jgi:hypothetical protein
MSTHQRFAHDEVVKVKQSGNTGMVKGVRLVGSTNVYQVQPGETAMQIDVPEDELELVKRANDDETGLAIRYIS